MRILWGCVKESVDKNEWRCFWKVFNFLDGLRIGCGRFANVNCEDTWQISQVTSRERGSMKRWESGTKTFQGTFVRGSRWALKHENKRERGTRKKDFSHDQTRVTRPNARQTKMKERQSLWTRDATLKSVTRNQGMSSRKERHWMRHCAMWETQNEVPLDGNYEKNFEAESQYDEWIFNAIPIVTQLMFESKRWQTISSRSNGSEWLWMIVNGSRGATPNAKGFRVFRMKCTNRFGGEKEGIYEKWERRKKKTEGSKEAYRCREFRDKDLVL